MDWLHSYFTLPVLIRINNLHSPLRHKQQKGTYFFIVETWEWHHPAARHRLLLWRRGYFLSQDWSPSHTCSGRTTLEKISFAATYHKDLADHWNHWVCFPGSSPLSPVSFFGNGMVCTPSGILDTEQVDISLPHTYPFLKRINFFENSGIPLCFYYHYRLVHIRTLGLILF